ncbi:hypothetical protein ACIBSW_16050 [Actinoplanes sp. NPDC049668]|uniref:hypothetical protein n=1 Tax=unclassified Actinoplanes TaxID=2626549 RepID=UPI0033AB75FF
MDEIRKTVSSYGRAFDETVELVARAMAAQGYSSKHAVATGSQASATELMDLLSTLGMLCQRMRNEVRGGLGGETRTGVRHVNFLAVYSSARRLILLFREAQLSGLLASRVAAEVDGDVDNLEELAIRLDDPDEIVEASRSLVAVSRLFEEQLPRAIRDELSELDELLRAE